MKIFILLVLLFFANYLRTLKFGLYPQHSYYIIQHNIIADTMLELC